MNRAEFVKFTLEKMDSPSGLFLQWKNYCLKQNSDESSCCKIRQETKEIDETKENEETKEDTGNKREKSESS